MKLFEKTGQLLLAGPRWVAGPVRYCLDRYESVRGPIYARRHHKESLARGRSIVAGLKLVKQRWPEVQSEEQQSPVFILSAGWRSGSTLLQRLVMSRQSILIWGEPYSHARVVSHLADGISAITASWPEEEWFIDSYDLQELDSTFVANMYPLVADLQQACIAYFKTLFEVPSRQRGFDRWGLKDVRLTIEDAHFMRWLFPNGKFIFLYRNPYDAYRSYRLDRSWYVEWPNEPVFTATEFGRHWSQRAGEFFNGASEFGGLLLRYEDLVGGAASIDALESYLGVRIESSLLGTKVGSHRSFGEAIPSYELRRLRNEVDVTAAVLGYECS